MSRQGRKNARSAMRVALRLYEAGRLDRHSAIQMIGQTVALLWAARSRQ